MLAILRWVRRRLGGGPAPLPPIPDGAAMASCPRCDGTGHCRVCQGAGTIDRLVAVAGADGGGISPEATQQMKTIKCSACPSSSGLCRVCQGRGVVLAPPAG